MAPPNDGAPPPPDNSSRAHLETLRRKAEAAADVLNGRASVTGVSTGQKVWMGLGLTLMTGVGSLPILLLL